MKNVQSSFMPTLTGISLGIILWLFMLFIPFFPSIPIVIEGHPPFHLIPWPGLSFLFLLISVPLPFATLGAYRRLRRTAPAGALRVRSLLPAAFLPWAFLGPLLPAVIPLWLSSNLLFYLPLTVLTLILARYLPSYSSENTRTIRRTATALLLGLTALYTAAGIYISSHVGEHQVDEGHYLIQAASLHEDGDLNIRNNFGFDVDQAIAELMTRETFTPEQEDEVRARVTNHFRAYLHISAFSPEGEWRSWHPYGLSLLLAPFSALGMPGRQFILGLVSALGSMLLFLLCIRLGRSIRWSTALILLLAGSCYWVAYSCRSLPEILGTTLLLAAVSATYAAARRPLLSFLLLLFSCGGMLLAHPRFAPSACLAGAFYFIHALFIHPFRRRTRLAYAGAVLAALLAVGLYTLFHPEILHKLTAYQTIGLFGVYPEGSWLILFSERGLFYSLPLAALLLVALLYALIADRPNRAFHTLAALNLLVMVLAVGSSDCWDGGPTTAGRYLLITVPLLIPAAVFLLKRTNPIGRCWALFLGLHACAITALSLFNLPRLGAQILHHPQGALRQTLPLLRELFEPYALSDIMNGKPYHGWDAFTVNPFPALLLVATALLLLPRKTRPLLQTSVLLLLLAAGTALHLRNGALDFIWPPEAIEELLAHTPLAHARLISQPLDDSPRLSPYANRFPAFRPLTLTTEDLGQTQRDTIYSQPHLDQNGWEGKGYRWFTLVPPFNAGLPGPRKLTIHATHTGPVDLYAAVKEGAHPLCYEHIPLGTPKGSFKWSTILDTGAHRGHTYLLFRLEGQGTVTFDSITWAPLPAFETTASPNTP